MHNELSMDPFRRTSNFSPNPEDPEQRPPPRRAYCILIILNLLSFINGCLLLGYSVYLLIRLYQDSCASYGRESCDVYWGRETTSVVRTNVQNWKIFLIAGAVMGLIQILACLFSGLCCPGIKSKTKCWCAAHALLFVCSLTIVIFVIISFRSQALRLLLDNFLTRMEQKIFIIVAAADMSLSLVAVGVFLLISRLRKPPS